MNKVCVVLLLIIMFISAVEAKESQVTANASAEDVSAPVSTDKTETVPAKKQSSSKPETVNLETAYKREFAFLEAQKRELTERLKTYQSTAVREEQTLGARIGTLERQSVERSAKIDQFTAQLSEMERKESAVSERNDALETTFLQAGATLKDHGIAVPATISEGKGNDQAKIDFLFKQAIPLLQELGLIRTKPGRFYLVDGKQVQGTILSMGNIAAYGMSESGSGSLAPAGGGEFKIWKSGGTESAVALSKNQQPDTLQLYLFESRSTAVEDAHEQTLLEHVDSGGPIGWVIVILGVIGCFFVLIRIYLLHANSANTKHLSDQILQQLAAGDLDVAKKSCEENSSAIGRVLLYTLRHLKDDRDHMEGIVYEAILQESGPLDRFGPAILVIASVAPLLGLLGTVTGMIETFDSITQFGTSDPRLLSEGIAIALVTTELGLVVAIPTLLLGSVLTTWARNIKRDMEHAALRIVNVFLGSENNEEGKSSDPAALIDEAGLVLANS